VVRCRITLVLRRAGRGLRLAGVDARVVVHRTVVTFEAVDTVGPLRDGVGPVGLGLAAGVARARRGGRELLVPVCRLRTRGTVGSVGHLVSSCAAASSAEGWVGGVSGSGHSPPPAMLSFPAKFCCC